MTLPRFYPVLDTAALSACGLAPLDAARSVLEAGVRILQLRHKAPYTRDDLDTAEQIARACENAGALFVVNDRADIARLAGAALHLGQDDLPPRSARAVVGPRAPVGFSTHNEQQLRAAAEEPVDYVALGPIFGTVSKDKPDPRVGTAELRRLRPLTVLPLAAIGGITRENAAEVLAAGADSVAVIGDLLRDVSTQSELRARAREWLQLTNN
ncbi:MAG TPA: thiamine phosphate synthase [Bryobacteraceae bacterium]|nr:thiamine phosphate synthase [Bryobacteraceae bacterium]